MSFALLTLPAEDKAIAHACPPPKAPEASAMQGVSSLNSGEANAFSSRRALPPVAHQRRGNTGGRKKAAGHPCGAVSGVFAQRALSTRRLDLRLRQMELGAATAAMTPPMSPKALSRFLQSPGIDLVRTVPRAGSSRARFSTRSSDDEDVPASPFGRLLILLRRLALRLGFTYVFEPHNFCFPSPGRTRLHRRQSIKCYRAELLLERVR